MKLGTVPVPAFHAPKYPEQPETVPVPAFHAPEYPEQPETSMFPAFHDYSQDMIDLLKQEMDNADYQ